MTNQPPRLTPTSGTTWPLAFTIERPWACSMLIWANAVLVHSPVNSKRLDRNTDDRRMTGCSSVIYLSQGTGFVAACRFDQGPWERLNAPTRRRIALARVGCI